jgi:REP element-mobilizing transposase RayT
MARPLRIEFPGAVYHVISRGNALSPVFLDDNDHRIFMEILGKTVRRYRWLCHAYCMMTNHYHLLVETPDANLSGGMHLINGTYTQRFNRNHNRIGHVFQGRFKSIIVEKESYLLELVRHIAYNPVRAGMVNDLKEYCWSSYQATAGLEKPPEFLHTGWVLGQFGSTPEQARIAFDKYMHEPSAKACMPAKLYDLPILGSALFFEKMQPYLKERSSIREIPRKQRFAGRPELTDLFSVRIASKAERNRLIRLAFLDFGYSQTEIANAAGLHYSTVSRIVQQNS